MRASKSITRLPNLFSVLHDNADYRPVIAPALFQAYPAALDEWSLSTLMRADGTLEAKMEAHYDTFIVSPSPSPLFSPSLFWLCREAIHPSIKPYSLPSLTYKDTYPRFLSLNQLPIFLLASFFASLYLYFFLGPTCRCRCITRY